MSARLSELVTFPRPYLVVSGRVTLQILQELWAFEIAAKLRVIAKTASMTAFVILTNPIAS
jgi:hypothetical protein